MSISLFVWAAIANMAVALVPHEPIVAWYGGRIGIVRTACWATAGTLAASWLDYRLFQRLVRRVVGRSHSSGLIGAVRGLFERAPFAVIAISGITPLPFLPIKALAFATGYPLTPYLVAVAAGRFPRYALLAWIGAAIFVPAWVGVAFCATLAAFMIGDLAWRLQRGK